MQVPGLYTAAPADANASPVFRTAQIPDELITNLQHPLQTCWEILVRGGTIGWDRPAFGTRHDNGYIWLTYRNFAELAFRLANGLTALGAFKEQTFREIDVCPRTGDPNKSRALSLIAVFCRNRVEWVITEQAANLVGAALVPLYATLGAESMRFILKQTQLRTVIVAAENLEALLEFRGEIPEDVLETVILLPPSPCLEYQNHCGSSLQLPLCPNCGEFDSPLWTPSEEELSKVVDKAVASGLRVMTFGQVLQAAEGIAISRCLPSHEGFVKKVEDQGKRTDFSPTQATIRSSSREGQHEQEALSNAAPAAAFQLLFQQGLFSAELLRPLSSIESISTICYTSGTTGLPKGAVLDHRGVIAIVAAILRGLLPQPGMNVGSTAVHYSYLPLAHVLERCIVQMALLIGARSGFARAGPQEMLKDLAALKPTVFLCVPRVLSVMENKVNERIQKLQPLVRWTLQTALKSKLKRQAKHPSCVTHSGYDVLLGPIRKLLGGHIQIIICGGAPLDKGLQARIACLFSVPVIQGFGMTECYGPVLVQSPRGTYGPVGIPLPAIEYKIVSPESSTSRYFPNENGIFWEGELCIRGAVTVEGYLSAPEASSDLYDGDWLKTGDVASLNGVTGDLRVVDRVKSLFKLAQGEYIAPEKLEGIYSASPWIAQIFVTGDPLATRPVAIVVPDAGVVAARMTHSLTEIINDESARTKLKNEILRDMTAAGVHAKLSGFEKVQNIWLREEPFTVENNTMTPTMKLRRRELAELMRPQIQQLYSEN